jgi:hypothetical protein
MTVADLIDLEAQLARDRDADVAVLERRDRALLAGVASASRPALLTRWLERMREAHPGTVFPGRTISSVLSGIRAVLVIIGFILGWAAASALLRYTGTEPVNVWDFLLAFVGVQLLLFALLLGSFVVPLAAVGKPLLGLVRTAVAAAYPRLAARVLGATDERLGEWRAFWHRLRSRRSLYHRLEPWILLAATQAFGVAFNVGAIAGCLRLIVFSDIAFAWSTTLVQLDASRFHALVHALAAPFAWLWPDADPSSALVAATRYSRLEGAYVSAGAGRAARPELVGGWWPFLLACVAFYGLLPRCTTLALSGWRVRRLLARLPLDDAEVGRVVRRLSEPHVETRSAAPELPVRAGPAAATPPVSARDSGTPCMLVLWRDTPAEPDVRAAVARQTGCTIASVHAAGGRDYEGGKLDWSRIADGVGAAVVVAEGWEAPDKAVLRLIADLRRALGPRREVIVLLAHVRVGAVAPSLASELRIWRDGLAPLEDPYLAVEPLRGSP